MDLENLRQALEAATIQVLEDTAFALTEPDRSPATAWPESMVLASLAFEGPVRGCFSLVAPPALCLTLAADITADDEVGDDAEAVLGEILNMVAGIVLDRMLSEEGQWELGVPRTERIGPMEQEARPQQDVRIRLLTEEDEPIEASVVLAREGGP